MRNSPAAWIALLGLALVTSPLLANEEARIGRKIDSFRLPDHHGRMRSLDEFSDAKAVVVVFLGTECPLVKQYGPRLAELSKQLAAQDVQIIGINSNLQDTITEIGAYARTFHIDFPILKDSGNVVADRFGAVRTPEAFVLDQDRVIRYWGRIDDQYGLGNASGYAKVAVEREDVKLAVAEILSGKPVSEPVTKAFGCLIGRVARVTPHGEITYADHIAKIIDNRCVNCHRPGELGPFALTNYEEVLGWAGMIREVVSEERMPPWFANPEFGQFENDCRLTEEERELIYQWVECGCPQGDMARRPALPEFVDGWQIGEPDAVFYMSDEPYTVAAEGTVEYQYFTVDTGFTEDKWITAAESRPGNRSVVHHIICFISPPGSSGGEGRGNGAQIGYAPGMPPRQFKPGFGMKIPAGARLTFQMHYTPNGVEQTDRSYVGFKFIDPKLVKHEVTGGLSGNVTFRIPPGDSNYKVTSTKKFRRDTMLLSMLPHMHLRGKSFRYEVKYPDGTEEILLDVPKYDFNWQLWYQLSQPKLLPKGTRMTCTAYFDNSEENPFNPDPTIEVTWGEQTWEEMMFGFMSFYDPNRNLQTDGAASAEEEEPDDDLPADRIAF